MIESDDLPDPEQISLGEPLNESYGAICAMLTEHMVDADRLNRWLIGLMLVALHDADASDVPLVDALEVVSDMNYADMAIAGFDSMNTLVGLMKKERQRGRRQKG